MSRFQYGKVVKFDPVTWWGVIALGDRKIEFHATCYIGATTSWLPSEGQFVRCMFSDETCKRILSVESRCVTCKKPSCEGTHIKYPCDEHKRYLAKRPPRSNCEDCWRFYIKMHPEGK